MAAAKKKKPAQIGSPQFGKDLLTGKGPIGRTVKKMLTKKSEKKKSKKGGGGY